jgi:hypothetical protein
MISRYGMRWMWIVNGAGTIGLAALYGMLHWLLVQRCNLSSVIYLTYFRFTSKQDKDKHEGGQKGEVNETFTHM